jgi:predicted DNA-binding transcriptional regulator YafY
MSAREEGFQKQNRGARLMRIWRLLYHHRPHGITAQELARRLDIGARTVYRDIKIIREEWKIAVHDDGQGRMWCEQSDFLPPLKLSLHEAVTLFLSARLMARFADKFDPGVKSAFEKLADVLPGPVAAHVNAIAADMASATVDRRYARVFEEVATAWAESRKLRIAYSRPVPGGQPAVTRRVVAPRYLEPNPWGLGCYLIADDDRSHDKRTFKLERITEAQALSERFEPEPDPTAPSQLSRAWTVSDEEPACVRIRFHESSAARRAQENRWHPSQKESTGPDGKLELTFEVAGLLEITPWILTWGDSVEVLAPPALRERIASLATGMARRYTGSVD